MISQKTNPALSSVYPSETFKDSICFGGDSFQYALGNLSISLSVLLLGSGKGTRRTKIWLRKMILIRRRSAGTEAGIGELFTSSELCQW